ncbi:MAG: hypothetical protein ABIN91_14420 [Mucilaginibacter sp.]|uniref:hypothetical protein n=1 Tax=Mucilaginibacter sp. TaxID=1882438 RepID=UPI0032638FAF
MPTEDSNIPAQQKGNQHDTVEQITVKTREQAIGLYYEARTRLLDVSNWSQIAHGPSSEFTLTDSEGHKITRLAQQGDKLKIDLPGPGSLIGGGNDWVLIEQIQDELDSLLDTELTSIRVRPTYNPESDEATIAHFFTNDATSTFLIKRFGTTVSAEIHGRNEIPNTHGNFIDVIRHLSVAMGDLFGFSKPQWKHLTKGLLDNELKQK